MEICVMTDTTIKRLKGMNISLNCKFCGEPIHEGEVCVRRTKSRNRPHTVYAHKICDEKRRY